MKTRSNEEQCLAETKSNKEYEQISKEEINSPTFTLEVKIET